MKDNYNRNKHKYTPMREESKIKISESIGGTDEENIKLFKSLPQYSEDDMFEKVWRYRNNGKRIAKWRYTCHKCVTDMYSEAGFRSSFISVKPTIIKGKPCRCNPKYRYSEGEKLLQVTSLCKDEGHTFISWFDGTSSFNWICSKGHNTKSRTSSFATEGRRCKYCRDDANGINGYYKDKVEFEDFLYVLKFKGFIKVGRSFNVKSRVHYIKQVSKEKPTIITLYTSDHQSTYDTEQIFLGILRDMGLQVYLDWTNECFKLEALDVVLKLLEEQNTLIKYK